MSLINTDMLKITLQYKILVNNNYYSLIDQLHPGFQYVDLEMA